MLKFFRRYEHLAARFDGCEFNLRSPYNNTLIKKPWLFKTSLSCIAETFHERLCNREHEHQPCAGRETVLTEGYNFKITDAIHKSYQREVEILNS